MRTALEFTDTLQGAQDTGFAHLRLEGGAVLALKVAVDAAVHLASGGVLYTICTQVHQPSKAVGTLAEVFVSE
eukprot:6222737-Pyramimonas_sp.AAC.1